MPESDENPILISRRANKTEKTLKELVKSETLTAAALLDVLKHESDRGCILVALDFLSNALERLLSAFFKSQSKIHKQDIKYLFESPNGPLSTVSNRANLAYASGLIDADVWQVISKIRSLRNMVGHSSEIVSLSSTAVSEIINSFKDVTCDMEAGYLQAGFYIASNNPPGAGEIEPCKQIFIVSATMVATEIIMNASRLEGGRFLSICTLSPYDSPDKTDKHGQKNTGKTSKNNV